MTSIPPPNRDPSLRVMGSLIAQMRQLNRHLMDQRNATRSFQNNFNTFVTNSRDFFRDWRGLVPGGGAGGGGGGGGPSVTGTAPPPPPDPQDKVSPVFQMFMSFGNQLIQNVKKMDELQARAMASNTTLQKMDIPNVGVRMSKLATEILDLREVGFKNLDITTMRLIGTMKMTNQGTQSLQGFLANTSLSLRLNTTQVQDMARRLSDNAVAYGMSQQKMFEAVNSLAQSVQTASLLGKGSQTAEALGEVAAMIGDRATKELGVVADFLTGIGNESNAMIAGIFSNYDKFLDVSKEDQTRLTLGAIRTFNNTFRQMTAGYGTGSAGRRAAAAIAEQFGGMQNVRAFQAVEAALDDSAKKTSENSQNLALLKTAEEQYANAMERSAAALESIVQKFSPAGVGTVGAVGGGLATVAGGIGAGVILRQLLRRVGIGAATGATTGLMGGPLGAALGAVVGIGSTLWGISDIMTAVRDASKKTEDESRKTNELLDPNKDNLQTRRTNSLLDILNTMVQTLNPQADTTSKESLAIQKEMVLQLQAVNTNIATKGISQPAGFVLTR